MRLVKSGLLSGVLLMLVAGTSHADPDLQQLVEVVKQQQQQMAKQQKQIEELKKKVDQTAGTSSSKQGETKADPAAQKAQLGFDASIGDAGGTDTGQDAANGQNGGNGQDVTNVVRQFLQANPGAGMPPGVQTGFEAGNGFYIRSSLNPIFQAWGDESRIPFELRIRGRVQLDYVSYNVQDNVNHLTGNVYSPQVGNESIMFVKRLRPIFEGHAFTPNLRYHFQFNASTRGLPGFQNNRDIETLGFPPAAAGGAPGIGGAPSPIGGAVTDNHAMQLFAAWVAYDIHLREIAPSLAGGVYYSPTLTFMFGKQQPFFGFTEVLGSANAQFGDFAAADWFFDSDDNNLLMAASVQLRAIEDRLFATFQVTNGNDSNSPAYFMDNLPGIIAGYWYDFGGTWNQNAKRWDLWGDSPSDLYYSYNPVVRVGSAMNLVPMGRRSIYGDNEQSRVFTSTAGPGGTRLINLLDGAVGGQNGANAVDKFNSYTFDTWASLHYRGFSLLNEWWARVLDGFDSAPAGMGRIVYQDRRGANALFPNHDLIDMGTLLQAGYFILPKKFELIARLGVISGDSGDIMGSGRFTTTTVPGVRVPVRIYQDAFSHFHSSEEIATGFNYFFYGQLVKWTTDLSFYRGGNPAAGGASPSGYIPGVDGWMVRTQLQFAF